MNTHFIWQLTLALTLLTTPVFAQEGASLTLHDVITAGLEKSEPALEGMRAQADKKANATEATTIDNPELQLDLSQAKSQNGTGVSGEIYQPLKLSQLTGQRYNYAKGLRQLADGERTLQDLKTINDISTAYLNLWSLQARKKLYERSLKDSEKLSGIVRKSTEVGQTARAVQELFSGDNELLSSEIKAVEAEINSATLDLVHLTGLVLQGKNLKKPEFSPVPENVDALVDLASRRTTWRTVLRDRVDVASRRLNVAETDGIMPEFGPRMFFSRSPDGNEEAVGVGVALRIPLWNQNDTEEQRARAELNHARTANDRYQQLPPAETIKALHSAAKTRQQRLNDLQDAVLPRYRKSYELTQAMFREGQANAIELWQVREKLYQTEADALNAVTEAYIARLKLEAEVGGKLEEVR